MTRIAMTAAFLLATAQLAAQTFVVDHANGQGTSFTDIATAIAAVPDGAVLIVRAGQYSNFTIDNKSVSVLADPGVQIQEVGVYLPIRNLAADQHVTLRGFTTISFLGPATVECTSCQGTVLLDSCTSGQPSSFTGSRLVVDDCEDVRVRNCIFQPVSGAPLRCTNSQLSVAQSMLLPGPLSSGSWLSNSTVELANAWLGGGASYPGAAPLWLDNSEVRILGRSWLTVFWQGFGLNGAPVVQGNGTVRVDPLTTMASGAAAPFAATIQQTTMSMPVVAADTDAANGIANAEMVGPSNGIGMLLVGLAGLPSSVPGIADPVMLLPGSETVQAVGPLNTSLVASYQIPASPLLVGAQITWQGACFDPGAGLQISNPVTYVH